jgi:plasmid stabilization system protein ParE
VTYEVVVLPKAQRDLVRLAALLAVHSPRAAENMGERLKAALRSLDEMPARAPLRDSVHELVVPFGDAGYAVSYRVETTRVLITRIFHTREHR